MTADHRILVGTAPSFPLMGKGRDRGARKAIRAVTPTYFPPRQGQGNRALSPVFISWLISWPKPQFSKEYTKAMKLVMRLLRFLPRNICWEEQGWAQIVNPY